MRDWFRSQQGFNLIEVALVLSVVGIVTALGVPTFLDARDKGREAEAKVNLNGIYSGMKMYHTTWLRYFGDFRNIGFDLKGPLKYRVGFGSAGPTAPANYVGPGASAGASAVQISSDHSLGFCGTGRDCVEVTGQISPFNPPGYTTGWGVNGSGDHWFLAGAGAYYGHRASGQRRQFILINQDKTFFVVNY